MSDPKEILSVKDGLLIKWVKLPPEHQATMLLVFLGHIGGDYQTWVRHAILTLSDEPPPKDPEAAQAEISFPITSLSWDDLKVVLSEDEVDLLTNQDLRKIAESAGDAYVDRGDFWEDVEFFASQLIRELQPKPEDDEVE